MNHSNDKKKTLILDSLCEEFQDIKNADEAIELFCVILINDIENALVMNDVPSQREGIGDFKTEVFEALDQVAQGAPLEILLAIEGSILETLPNDPSQVSEMVKNKINEIFDGLLSSSKKSAPSTTPSDPAQTVLSAPLQLREDILQKVPNIEINIANIKLSLHAMIKTVLSDRVMEKFYNNVLTPAKKQAEETAKSRVIPLVIGIFLLGGLTGGVLTYFITRKKTKNRKEVENVNY